CRMLFFLSSYAVLRDLHPFPTRRSSDLGVKTSHSPKSCSATSTDSSSSTREPKSSGAPRLRADFVFAPSSPFSLSPIPSARAGRSEEHTSELQSLRHLVCRLLLEKKKQQ